MKNRHVEYQLENLRRQISDAAVVSFDIFDTLIMRPYQKATDLFLHLEESFSLPGFAKARVETEQKVRMKMADGQEEISFAEIYQEMPKQYSSMKSAELELELQNCFPDEDMQKIYRLAQTQKKRIFITSDMYLPEDFIIKLLKKNGYTSYEKLLLSSTQNRTKYTGTLYQELISFCKDVPASKILHIGDNELTDYQNALSAGIQAYHYIPALTLYGAETDFYLHDFCRFVSTGDDPLSKSMYFGLLAKYNQRRGDSDFWEKVGFEYAGYMVVGFCQWLHAEVLKNKIQHIFFLARDGYIIQQVFEKLYPKEFKTSYLYASRSALMFTGKPDFDLWSFQLFLHGDATYQSAWEFFRISDQNIYNAYLEQFPDQKKQIPTQKREELISFFKKNIKTIQDQIDHDNSLYLQLLTEHDFFQDKVAMVDIGWGGSMQKGFEALLRVLGKNTKIYGYYLGMHEMAHNLPHADSYLAHSRWNVGNEPFQIMWDVLSKLELFMTAPMAGIQCLKRTENGCIEPVFQKIYPEEQKRIDTVQKIHEGIMFFTDYFLQATGKFKKILSVNFHHLLLHKLNHLTEEESIQFSQISEQRSSGDNAPYSPLELRDPKKEKIGIIFTWPGTAVSAEAEVIQRILIAGKNIGLDIIPISQQGCILRPDTSCSPNYINTRDFKWIFSIHYEDGKLLDCFYYLTVWNPPENLMGTPWYKDCTDRYLQNDDYLIYDTGGMSNHLRSILLDSPRDLKDASCFVGSFPASCVMSPNLSKPMLFYCGVNWDVLITHKGRHQALFNLLDSTGIIKIFGPKDPWKNGILPWAGFKSYQGEIPFDGTSILSEINKCGIVLALSSDIHHRAGAVTNRVYEGCAAGAVIISDDNSFMLENFKDAVLFIRFNKNDPQDTFRQIMEKYEWILSHKDEALALAKKSQQIFREKFCLEKQLQGVLANHEKRQAAVARMLYAKDPSQKVLVLTLVSKSAFDAEERNGLTRILDNIHNQKYKNITLAVAADSRIESEVRDFVRNDSMVQVIPLELYNFKHTRIMTDEEVFGSICRRIPHDYMMYTDFNEQWFSDHVTTLVRTLEENPQENIAFSGRIRIDFAKNRNNDLFGYPALQAILQFNAFLPGQLLFRAVTDSYLPEFTWSSIDGFGFYARLVIDLLKRNHSLAFSKRQTFAFEQYYQARPTGHVLGWTMQQRFILDLVKYDLEKYYMLHPMSLPPPTAPMPPLVPPTTTRSLGYRLAKNIYKRFGGRWILTSLFSNTTHLKIKQAVQLLMR